MDRYALKQLAALYGSEIERPQGRNLRLRCPLTDDPIAHPRGRRSLSFSVEVTASNKSRAHCFACLIGGSLVYIFGEAQKRIGGFELALELIEELDKGGFAAAMSEARFAYSAGDKPDRTAKMRELSRYSMRCYRVGVHDYALKRGIVRSDIDTWKIGHDIETHRMTMPVWNEEGMVVGVCRRAVFKDMTPKYHDQPTGQWKNEVFYGEHLVDPTIEHVRFAEGPISTIFAARVLPNVLGFLGSTTGITDARLTKLRSWAKVVTFLFDGDEAGHEAVYGKFDLHGKWHPGLYEILRPHFTVRVATLPPNSDPANMTGQALVKADRESLMPAFDYRAKQGYILPPPPLIGGA